jgi:hypothetical protein
MKQKYFFYFFLFVKTLKKFFFNKTNKTSFFILSLIFNLEKMTENNNNNNNNNNLKTLAQTCTDVINKELPPVLDGVLNNMSSHEIVQDIIDGTFEGMIESTENHVTGGRYPNGDQKHFALYQGMVSTNPLEHDTSRYGKEAWKHIMMKKPHGHLKVSGIIKKPNGGKKIKLRFDDTYNLDAWIEFEIDHDKLQQQIDEMVDMMDDDEDDEADASPEDDAEDKDDKDDDQ